MAWAVTREQIGQGCQAVRASSKRSCHGMFCTNPLEGSGRRGLSLRPSLCKPARHISQKVTLGTLAPTRRDSSKIQLPPTVQWVKLLVLHASYHKTQLTHILSCPPPFLLPSHPSSSTPTSALSLPLLSPLSFFSLHLLPGPLKHQLSLCFTSLPMLFPLPGPPFPHLFSRLWFVLEILAFIFRRTKICQASTLCQAPCQE